MARYTSRCGECGESFSANRAELLEVAKAGHDNLFHNPNCGECGWDLSRTGHHPTCYFSEGR